MQHKRIALVTGANRGVGLQVAKERHKDGERHELREIATPPSREYPQTPKIELIEGAGHIALIAMECPNDRRRPWRWH